MQETEKIAGIYARALMELAAEASALQQVGEELDMVCEILQRDDAVWRFFQSPLLLPEDKLSIIKQVFKEKLHETLFRFLGVLNSKRRLGVLPVIAREYRSLMNEKMGKRSVEIITSFPVDAPTKEKIVESLKQFFKTDVVLDLHVDPEMMGGMVIRSQDLMMDSSVRTALERMKHNLLNREIRGGTYYEN